MNENVFEIVQHKATLTMDSIPVVEMSVDYSEENIIQYTELDNVKEITLPANGENPINIFVMGYEYVSILLIMVLVYSIYKHYRKLALKIFNSLGSFYLISRYLDNVSLGVFQMYLLSAAITIISGALLMFKIVPNDFFNNMPLLVEFKIPIFLLVIALLILINSFTFKIARLFFNRKWDVLKKVAILSKTHTLFHAIIILIALFVSYFYPNNNYLVSQVIALGGLFIVFSYTFFITCVFFYSKNVSFLQYILYFCTVKMIGMCFFGYYLWKTISYI